MYIWLPGTSKVHLKQAVQDLVYLVGCLSVFKVMWLGDLQELSEQLRYERMGRVGGCRGAKVEAGARPRATRLDVSGEVRSGY